MWPSSPARAWARRASMVSSIPDSLSVRSALSRAPVSIVVVMMVSSAGGDGWLGGGRRGEHGRRGGPPAVRAVTTPVPSLDRRGAARRRCRGSSGLCGEQRVGAVQERGGTAVPGRAVGLGAGGEDALDGAVGRVAGGDGLGAGGLEPAGLVLVGQAEHALGGAQPVAGR